MKSKKIISLLVVFTMMFTFIPSRMGYSLGDDSVEAVSVSDARYIVDLVIRAIEDSSHDDANLVDEIAAVITGEDGVNKFVDSLYDTGVVGITESSDKNLVEEFALRGYSKEEVYTSLKILSLYNAKDLSDKIRRSQSNKGFGVSDYKSILLSEELKDAFPKIEENLKNDGYSIDDIAYFIFLSTDRSLSGILTSSAHDEKYIRYRDGTHIERMSKLLEGVYTSDGKEASVYVESMMETFVASLNKVCYEPQNNTYLKNILFRYDLYDPYSEPAIMIVPYLEDDDSKMDVGGMIDYDIIINNPKNPFINSDNKLNNVESLQFDIGFNNISKYKEFKYWEIRDLIKTEDNTDRPLIGLSSFDESSNTLTIGVTGLTKIWSNQPEHIIWGGITSEIKALGNPSLKVSNLIISDSDNNDIEKQFIILNNSLSLIDYDNSGADKLLTGLKIDNILLDKDYIETNKSKVVISGGTPHLISLMVNEKDVMSDILGDFSNELVLNEGINHVVIKLSNGINATIKDYYINVKLPDPSGSISIDNYEGDASSLYINSRTIDLSIESANCNEIWISQDKDFTTYDKHTVNSDKLIVKDYRLTDGDGLKSVYAKLIRSSDNSEIISSKVISNSINLDTLAPTPKEMSLYSDNYQGLNIGDIVEITAKAMDDEQLMTCGYKFFDGETMLFEIPKSDDVFLNKGYGKIAVTEDTLFGKVDKVEVYFEDKAGNLGSKMFDMPNGFKELKDVRITMDMDDFSSMLIKLKDNTTGQIRYKNMEFEEGVVFDNILDGHVYDISWIPSEQYKYSSGEVLGIKFDGDYVIPVDRVKTGTVLLKLTEKDSGDPISTNITFFTDSRLGYGKLISTDEQGNATVDGIPLMKGRPTVINYRTNSTMYKNITGFVSVTEEDPVVTKNIQVEDSYSISGKVIGVDDKPLQNVEITAMYRGMSAITRTSEDGSFNIAGLGDSSVNLFIKSYNSTSDGLTYISKSVSGVVPKQDEDQSITVKLEPSATISGTLSLSDGNNAQGVQVIAVPLNKFGSEFGQVTMLKGKVEKDGRFVISGLRPDEYKLRVYKYKDYEPYESDTQVVLENPGDESLDNNILLSKQGERTHFETSTTGIKVDKKYVAVDGFVNVEVFYKNLDSLKKPINDGVLLVDIPSGFNYVSGPKGATVEDNIISINIGKLDYKEEGKVILSLKASGDDLSYLGSYTVSASLRWNEEGTSITEVIGASNVSMLSVNIVGQNIISDSNMKVYGEAPINSEILIYDLSSDNQLVGVAKATGKKWSYEITNITNGDHKYYAVTTVGDDISVSSDVLEVTCQTESIKLSSAVISSGWNGRIKVDQNSGVANLSVSQGEKIEVLIDLDLSSGLDVNGSMDIAFGYNHDGSSKLYTAKQISKSRYKAELIVTDDMYGVEHIFARFNDNGLSTGMYDIPLASITVLIDPSGYVYDAVEGASHRIDGIETTLYVYDLDKKDYVVWDAKSSGQINPIITSGSSDDNGRYGWDVPGGDGSDSAPYKYYRVDTYDPSGRYASYSTTLEKKWIDDDIGIAVLPARFDVNIGLVDTLKPVIVSTYPASNQSKVAIDSTCNIQFSKKMNPADTDKIYLYEKVGNKLVDTINTLSSDGKTVIMKPVTELSSNTDYIIEVLGTIRSSHGFEVTSEEYDDYLNMYNRPLGIDKVIEFKTSDALKSVTPNDGSTNVDIGSKIVIEYSKDVQIDLLSNDLKLSVKNVTTGEDVDVIGTYDSSKFILSLKPNLAFSYSTVYRVSVKGVKGVQDTEFSFKTIAKPVEPNNGGDSGSNTDSGRDKDSHSSSGSSSKQTDTSYTNKPITSNVIKDTNDDNVIEKVKMKVDKNGSINQRLFEDRLVFSASVASIVKEQEIEVSRKSKEDLSVMITSSYQKSHMLSDVYDINIDHESLKKPIEVSFKVDSTTGLNKDKIAIFTFDESKGNWVYVGGKFNEEDSTISASLNHFSKYSVIYNDKSFKDIGSHWAKDDIEVLASRYIISGVGDDYYEPERNITRAEFCALISKSLGLEYVGDDKQFNDVDSTQWYFGAISAAQNAGIVSGSGNGNFDPDGLITREQMATMIMNAYVYHNGNDFEYDSKSLFNDDYSISDYAKKSVYGAKSMGILNGLDNGEFSPKDKLTRAQAAKALRKLLEVIGVF